jgi:hypothetical protein
MEFTGMIPENCRSMGMPPVTDGLMQSLKHALTDGLYIL